MPEQTLKEKTAKGLFWGGMSNFLQQLIGMVFGIVIARILSPDDYGLVAMLAIFTAIANTIMDSGFTTALINRKTIEHKDYNAVFWFNIFVGVGIYILLFFSAPLIAKFYNQSVLTNLSRLIFLSFVIAGTGIAHNAILMKKIMAKQRGIIDMSAVFCSGLIGLILALNGYAFWGLAIQQVSQTLISVILRWHFSPWRPTFQFDFSPLREMFGFSSKMLFATLTYTISANIFSVIMGRFYGKKQAGYYSQGQKWSSMGNSIISGMIMGIAQPILREAVEDKKRQLNIFRKMIRFGAFITTPSLLGLAFVGKEFIFITVGNKWMESVIFLQLFSIWGSISYLWVLYINIILAYGKANIYITGVSSVCLLQLLALIVMRPYGLVSMIIVYLSIYPICIFCWHYYINKLIGLRICHILKDIMPYVIATLFSIFIATLITMQMQNCYIIFIMKIIIVIVLYLAILWKLDSVMLKECLLFIRRKIKE